MIEKRFDPSLKRDSLLFTIEHTFSMCFSQVRWQQRVTLSSLACSTCSINFPLIMTLREWSFRRWNVCWIVIKIDLVLDVLRAMSFKLAHANTPEATRLRRAFNSLIVELDWVIEVSSANIVRVVFCGRNKGRPLMNNRKKRGPRMFPCGTPIDTGRG